MTEDFKERCTFEVGLIVAEHKADNILKTIQKYEDIWFIQYLKILIFAGSGCFLPKKQILNTETRQPYVHFTAKKPKIIPEYEHDSVWELLIEAGIPLEITKDYTLFKKVYYSKDKKKKRCDRFERKYDIQAPKYNY